MMPAGEAVVEPVPGQGAAEASEHAGQEAPAAAAIPRGAVASGPVSGAALHRPGSSGAPGPISWVGCAAEEPDQEDDPEDDRPDQQEWEQTGTNPASTPGAARGLRGGTTGLTGRGPGIRAAARGSLGDLLGDRLRAPDEARVHPRLPLGEVLGERALDLLTATRAEEIAGIPGHDLAIALGDEHVDTPDARLPGPFQRGVPDRLAPEGGDRLDDRRDSRLLLGSIEDRRRLADGLLAEHPRAVADLGGGGRGDQGREGQGHGQEPL